MLDSESGKARAYGINRRHTPIELILSNHLVEDPFYLSYIATEIISDVFGYLLRNDEFFFTSLLLEDSQTSLKIWFIDIHHYSPLKSTHKARLDFSEFFRRTVRAEDDLLSCIIEDIKECIDFLLCSLFSSQELDIVDQEDVDSSEASTHLIDFPILDSIDVFRYELIRGYIDYFFIWIFFLYFERSSLKEVGLSKPHFRIEEKRIIIHSWFSNHCIASRICELIARSYDEVLEVKARRKIFSTLAVRNY